MTLDSRLKEIKERWASVEKRATVPWDNLDRLQTFLNDLNSARTDVPMLVEMVEFMHEQLGKCKAETWMDCLNIDLEKIAEKYK